MKDTDTWTRRRALKAIGTSIAALPLVELWACHDERAHQLTDLGLPQDMGRADQETSAQGWATGGTAAMLALMTYPDPFTEHGSTCILTCGTTLGPCHTTSPERQDISDGLDGIPLRLALRVVDEDCTPVKGAVVEIWHTNYKGVYSGRINPLCNHDEEDRDAQYFRGYQRTDEQGKAFFNTCYPGWYRGASSTFIFAFNKATTKPQITPAPKSSLSSSSATSSTARSLASSRSTKTLANPTGS